MGLNVTAQPRQRTEGIATRERVHIHLENGNSVLAHSVLMKPTRIEARNMGSEAGPVQRLGQLGNLPFGSAMTQ